MSHLKVHVRKNDMVVVASGKDKGKIGGTLEVNPKTGKAIVQGINVVEKYQKPTRANAQGGIVEREGVIHSSKVILYCTKCKGATRISSKVLEGGTRARVCKKCGKTF